MQNTIPSMYSRTDTTYPLKQAALFLSEMITTNFHTQTGELGKHVIQWDHARYEPLFLNEVDRVSHSKWSKNRQL
jgi:hypothetical protein